MTWIIPENKLDDQQRDFLDNVDVNRSNIWIKGFAGSGKSVLLAFLAKRILSNQPDASLLLVVFTKSLVEMFRDAFREMGLNVNVDTYYGFMKSTRHYSYILCDEVQDLTPRVISAMVSNCQHVVVAGDSNQSIYEYDPKWHEPTVSYSQIERLIAGKSFELGIIHRLSRSIIDAVQRFLPRMAIFSSKRDMMKSDTQIRLCSASSESREVDYVVQNAVKAVNQGYSAAILIPTQKAIVEFINSALRNEGKPEWTVVRNRWNGTDFGAMNRHLRDCGINIQYVGNGYGSFSEQERYVTLMTYHSAKGLDFDYVFMPFVSSGMYICPNEDFAKTLFMVAMTRSRQDLFISYVGSPHYFLDSFKSNCSPIDVASVNSQNRFTQKSGNTNGWGF